MGGKIRNTGAGTSRPVDHGRSGKLIGLSAGETCMCGCVRLEFLIEFHQSFRCGRKIIHGSLIRGAFQIVGKSTKHRTTSEYVPALSERWHPLPAGYVWQIFRAQGHPFRLHGHWLRTMKNLLKILSIFHNNKHLFLDFFVYFNYTLILSDNYFSYISRGNTDTKKKRRKFVYTDENIEYEAEHGYYRAVDTKI